MAGTTTSPRSSIGDKARSSEIRSVQEPFHPPQPAYVDTTAALGFPSPSSAYFSPQEPTITLHHPHKSKGPKMGVGHTSGDSHAGFTAGSSSHEGSGRRPSASESNHHAVGSPRGEKRALPDDTFGGASGGHTDGKVSRRSRTASDPHATVASPTSSTSRDKTPSSPSARAGSRFSVPPPNGITPIMASDLAELPQAGTSAHPAQTPNRLSSSILDYFPEQKRMSLASDRPAPASPSRRQSAITDLQLQPPQSVSSNIIPPTPTTDVPSSNTLAEGSQFIVLKIVDFAYRDGDPRRQYNSTLDLYEIPRPSSPAPLGFLAPTTMNEAEESEASSNFGYIPRQRSGHEEGGGWLSKGTSDNSEELEEEFPSFQLDSEAIDFTPGVYKALYAFEPEGAAEMALEEEMEVTCLGRGGGDGWLVAVKELTADGEVTHALVPEAYMQLIRPLNSLELDEAMGHEQREL